MGGAKLAVEAIDVAVQSASCELTFRAELIAVNGSGARAHHFKAEGA